MDRAKGNKFENFNERDAKLHEISLECVVSLIKCSKPVTTNKTHEEKENKKGKKNKKLLLGTILKVITATSASLNLDRKLIFQRNFLSMFFLFIFQTIKI